MRTWSRAASVRPEIAFGSPRSLIDAATGSHLWAERYDRELKDIFAVQDEVVQTIVVRLVGRMAASGADAASAGRPKPGRL